MKKLTVKKTEAIVTPTRQENLLVLTFALPLVVEAMDEMQGTRWYSYTLQRQSIEWQDRHVWGNANRHDEQTKGALNQVTDGINMIRSFIYASMRAGSLDPEQQDQFQDECRILFQKYKLT